MTAATANPPSDLYIGAMSGTSLDGLDIAVVRLATGALPELLSSVTLAYPESLALALGQLARNQTVDIRHLGTTDVALGAFIGTAIRAHLAEQNIAPAAIRAIGSHGQTIHHAPRAEPPFTMQIGSPATIAEHSNITVVADFRSTDMAAGGDGAPLVPQFHAGLLGGPAVRAVVNIGGIANITLIRAGRVLAGTDTGPGNTLLDGWCRAHDRGSHDADGRWAATGSANPQLLDRCLAEPWFSAPGPRSTGPEQFNLAWLRARLRDESPEDVQATLVELTAQTIVDAISAAAVREDVDAPTVLIVCGGGRHNPELMAALTTRAPVPVITTDRYGIDGDQVEAMAFAWLARERLAQRSANAPVATGATGDRVLGAVYAAPRDLIVGPD